MSRYNCIVLLLYIRSSQWEVRLARPLDALATVSVGPRMSVRQNRWSGTQPFLIFSTICDAVGTRGGVLNQV